MPTKVSIALAVAFALAQMNSSTASASTLTWDSDAIAGNGVTDGSGTWDTTSLDWLSGGTDSAWVNANNDIAVFGNGGTGGSGTSTVTLGAAITVGGLTFNSSSTTGNYIIAGGGNTLTFGGAGATDTITANVNATISAALAQTGSVTTLSKAGSGILELSGGATFTNILSGPSTGSLFLTGGTFTVAGINNDAAAHGAVFQTGGTVNSTTSDWDQRANVANPYDITGGTLTVTPANRIRGMGTFNASGSAVVNFVTGDLRIASDNTSGTLSINGSASVKLSSATNNGLININNGGTTSTGTINLNGGTLTANGIVDFSGAGGAAAVNFNGGTLKANNSAVTLGFNFFGASATMTAKVYGGGAIVDTNGFNNTIQQALLGTTGNGVDTVTVTAGGTYTAPPTVTFSGGGGTGATGYAIINTSGVVTSIVITNPGSGYTSAPTIAFGSGSATATSTAALVNANGGFTKNGAGTLTLSGANTFTGDTVVNLGTLTLANSLALQNSVLNYNNQGGAVSFGSLTAATLGGLKGAQNLSASGVTALTLNNGASTSSTYTGVIANGTGTLALTKAGTGTQTLSGVNTYTGATAVNAGTLVVTSSGKINSSSAITVGVNGTFQYDGSATTSTVSVDGILKGTGVLGNVTINSGGFVKPGDSPGNLTTANFSLATGTLAEEITGAGGTGNAGSTYDLLSVNGTVTLGGTLAADGTIAATNGNLYFIINNDSTDAVSGLLNGVAQGGQITLGGQIFNISYTGDFGSSTFSATGNDVVLQAVPEPSTWVMLIGGLGILVSLQRLRRPQV